MENFDKTFRMMSLGNEAASIEYAWDGESLTIKGLNEKSFSSVNGASPFSEYDIESFIERGLQGYSSVDLWNIDSWFCEMMPRMLHDFRENSKGHPCDMSMEEWEAILERLIFCFNEMKIKKESLDVKDGERLMKITQEAFELFAKYFWHLWW